MTAPVDPAPPEEQDEPFLITPEGLGPILFGQPVPPGAHDLVEFSTECSSGFWRTTDAAEVADGGYGHEGGPAFTIWAADADAPVQYIDVLSATIPTPEGISVGSSLDEVEQAYPAATRILHDSFASLFAVDEGRGGGQLIIELSGTDEGYWGADTERVRVLRVIPADEAPTVISGTDNVLGYCMDW